MNHDGTGNNPTNPLWGSSGQPQHRICSANYKDGKSVMWDDKPNPRVLSNLVGKIEGPMVLSIADWNMLFPIWVNFWITI